jgi:hypothetical protein
MQAILKTNPLTVSFNSGILSLSTPVFSTVLTFSNMAATNKTGWLCAVGLMALMFFSRTILASELRLHEHHADQLYPRQLGNDTVDPVGECPYVKVVAGDTCDSLTQRCGNVTIGQFQSYNGAGNSSSYNATFCNGLNVDQVLCCGAGSQPDFGPKPNADGSCLEWTIRNNDTCTDLGVCQHSNPHFVPGA